MFIYIFINSSHLKNVFIYLAALGLHCWGWAFSSCGEWGPLSSCGVGFSLWRLLIVEDRCCGVHASVVVACGLSGGACA